MVLRDRKLGDERSSNMTIAYCNTSKRASEGHIDCQGGSGREEKEQQQQLSQDTYTSASIFTTGMRNNGDIHMEQS